MHATLSGSARNAVTFLRRWYSNALTDSSKQASLDLFHGLHVPCRAFPPVWSTVRLYTRHARMPEAALPVH